MSTFEIEEIIEELQEHPEDDMLLFLRHLKDMFADMDYDTVVFAMRQVIKNFEEEAEL